MDKRFVVFLVVLFSVFTADFSQGDRKLAKSIWDDDDDEGANVRDFDIDDDVAEGEWSCCRNELKDNAKPKKEIYSDLSWSSHNSVEFDSPFSVTRILQNVVADLVEFGKSSPSRASSDEQDVSSNEFEKVFTNTPASSRRSLRATHIWSKIRAAESVSSPGPAADSAPEAGVTSPSPPISSMFAGLDNVQVSSNGIPQQSSHVHKYLIAAVITSSVVGLLAVALLFIVICSRKKDEPKDGNKYGVIEDKARTPLNYNSIFISVGSKTHSAAINIKGEDITVESNSVCSSDVNGDFPKAEPLKTEAEPLKMEAEPLKTEAEPQKTEAKPQKTEAEPQKPEAETQKPEAEPPKTEAEHQKKESEPQEMEDKPQKMEVIPEIPAKTKPLPLPPGRVAPPSPLMPPTRTPPPPPPAPSVAPPPPPPNIGSVPPNAPPLMKPSSPGHHRRRSSGGEGRPLKTKLKPLFWDKVLANPDHSMVWNEIRAGSFQFNEEMMETLFGLAAADKNKNDKTKNSLDNTPQLLSIIDRKKAQNLSILLKALNVTTEEVCEALKEGNELPPELSQTLLKMAPTADEELKLRLYDGDITQLGPAERFLKALVDIPFAFKRLEALLFADTFEEEFDSLKESLKTLEVACKELKNSRLFFKLLEAVLKTGNRMNDGTYRGGATAFKLDTLLKLSDVKGTDGKTTLLHFVILEIIRSEGKRAARKLNESQSTSSATTEGNNGGSSQDMEEYHRSLGLQVVSGLSSELENVKKAAVIDTQSLTDTVSKLGEALKKTKDFFNTDMMNIQGEDHFREALTEDLDQAELDVKWLREEQKRILDLVKSTGDYFHGKSAKDEGLHLFGIVREFLQMLDKSCDTVKKNYMSTPSKVPKKEALPSSDTPNAQASSNPSDFSADIRRRLFPSMRDRQKDDGFSTDEDT